jgi:hypothetical protein
MGRPRLKDANGDGGGMISSFIFVILLYGTLHVTQSQIDTTMGIMTHATLIKEKPTKTTITPPAIRRMEHCQQQPT